RRQLPIIAVTAKCGMRHPQTQLPETVSFRRKLCLSHSRNLPLCTEAASSKPPAARFSTISPGKAIRAVGQTYENVVTLSAAAFAAAGTERLRCEPADLLGTCHTRATSLAASQLSER